MNAPVFTYQFDAAAPRAFAELAIVRVVRPVMTDEGNEVPVDTEGTVVSIYRDGKAYEIEFEAGLATVEREALRAI